MKNLDVAALTVPFGLILARLGAFVVSCPLFVGEQVPMVVRSALSVSLAIALTASSPHWPLPTQLGLAVLGEVCLGLLFGLCVRLMGVAVHLSGELIDTSVGFTFARQLDPLANEEAGPVTHLCRLLAATSFVLADGQHTVLRALAHSLQLVPPGSAGIPTAGFALLAERFSDLLAVGLRLAIPIVVSLMGVQLALAMLARLAPALNIWAVGFLATSGMGLIAIWLFSPAWLQALDALWRAPNIWAWGS